MTKRGLALKDFLLNGESVKQGDVIERVERIARDDLNVLVWAGPIAAGDENNLTIPGVYLSCWHGFKDMEQRELTDDWGSEGPIIGPFTFIQTTYAQHLKCHLAPGFSQALYEPFGFRIWNDEILELYVVGDCLVINDIEYGDWSMWYHAG